jgi:phosphoenolpyruvate carboxylase
VETSLEKDPALQHGILHADLKLKEGLESLTSMTRTKPAIEILG